VRRQHERAELLRVRHDRRGLAVEPPGERRRAEHQRVAAVGRALHPGQHQHAVDVRGPWQRVVAVVVGDDHEVEAGRAGGVRHLRDRAPGVRRTASVDVQHAPHLAAVQRLGVGPRPPREEGDRERQGARHGGESCGETHLRVRGRYIIPARWRETTAAFTI
jgi:hypothetical protein